MDTAANKNFFPMESSSLIKCFDDLLQETKEIDYGELTLQRFARDFIKRAYSKLFIYELASQLITLIEHFHAFRQMERVEKLTEAMLRFPLPDQYENIAKYYKALCVHRFGRGYVSDAQTLLESIIEDLPLRYRARAIMSLGATAFRKGEHDYSLWLHAEASRVAAHRDCHSSFVVVEAARQIAILKGIQGDHRTAVNDLETLFPLVRVVGASKPRVYYDYLNSIAVELMEVGRIQEARNASSIAVSSIFAPAYPEWRETFQEAELKLSYPSRSFVALSSAPLESVDHLAEQTAESEPEPENENGRVVIFPRRFNEAVGLAKPDAVTWRTRSQQLDSLTLAEKRAMLLAMAYDEKVPEQDYDRALLAAGLVVETERTNEVDLEGDGELERLMVKWCNLLDPEEFAAVMSALRDCDDDQRRNQIIDKMIGYAFRESPARSESEAAWRGRVEARLRSPWNT